MLNKSRVAIEYIGYNLQRWFWHQPDVAKLDLEACYPQVKQGLLDDIRFKYPKTSLDKLQDDERFFEYIQCENTLEALFYYRLERALFLSDPQNIFLPYLAALMKGKTGIELYYTTEIGRRCRIVHGIGTVIGPFHCIGDNVTIYQGVTIGKTSNDSFERVNIGNGVTIYAGAKVLGAITVADGAQIAANAVLLSSTEKCGIYAGAPAKLKKLINGVEDNKQNG